MESNVVEKSSKKKRKKIFDSRAKLEISKKKQYTTQTSVLQVR